jgi:hypothetical protein
MTREPDSPIEQAFVSIMQERDPRRRWRVRGKPRRLRSAGAPAQTSLRSDAQLDSDLLAQLPRHDDAVVGDDRGAVLDSDPASA